MSATKSEATKAREEMEQVIAKAGTLDDRRRRQLENQREVINRLLGGTPAADIIADTQAKLAEVQSLLAEARAELSELRASAEED